MEKLMNNLNIHNKKMKGFAVRLRAKKSLVFSILVLNMSLSQTGHSCDIYGQVENEWDKGKFQGGIKLHLPLPNAHHNPHNQVLSESDDTKAIKEAARKVTYQKKRIADSDEQKSKAVQKFTKLAQPLVVLGCDRDSLFDLIGSHKAYHKNKDNIVDTLFSMPAVANQFQRKDLSTLVDQLEEQRHNYRHHEWRKDNGEKHLKRKKRKLNQLNKS